MSSAKARILGAVLVAGAAASAWYAWDSGLIPGNPRAPTQQAFEAALVAALQDALPETDVCVPSITQQMRGENNIHPVGMRNNAGAGIFAVTLAPEIGGEQTLRHLEVLRHLAQAGLYKESDTEFVDESGTSRKAKRYEMTPAGWYNAGPQQCMQLGQRTFKAVTQVSRLVTNDGTQAYEIGYAMQLRELPAWAKTDKAEAMFPQLKSVAGPVVRTAKLVRTSSGWDVRFVAPGSVGNQTSAPIQYLEAGQNPRAPKVPALSEVAKAFADATYSQPLANVACLMLPDAGSADEIGDLANADPAKPYYAIYYDDPSKRPELNRSRADGLALMRALQKIGMVDEDIASDMAVNGFRYSGGAVFRLKQNYKVLLDPKKTGCLPIVSLTPEVKSMRVIQSSTESGGGAGYTVQVTGIARAGAVQPWVTETGADKNLALVKWIVAEGLPMWGTLRYSSKAGMTGVQGNVARPVYASSEKPEALFAGLARFYAPGTVKSPSAGNEAHAVVVYEAKTARTFGQHLEGTIVVSIGKTAAPIELFLGSYEPVLWRLRLEPGARVKRIVTTGYHPQRVADAPRGAAVETNKQFTFPHADTRAITSGLRKLTDARIKSVQTRYTGVEFGIGETLHPTPSPNAAAETYPRIPGVPQVVR